MNPTFESWSLRWHELQRSVADSFGTESARLVRVRAPLAARRRTAMDRAAHRLSRARSLALR